MPCRSAVAIAAALWAFIPTAASAETARTEWIRSLTGYSTYDIKLKVDTAVNPVFTQRNAIVKYTSAGVLSWKRTIKPTSIRSGTEITEMAIDSTDSIIVNVNSCMDSSTNPMKFDKNGTKVWEAAVGTNYCTAPMIGIDKCGNSYYETYRWDGEVLLTAVTSGNDGNYGSCSGSLSSIFGGHFRIARDGGWVAINFSPERYVDDYLPWLKAHDWPEAVSLEFEINPYHLTTDRTDNVLFVTDHLVKYSNKGSLLFKNLIGLEPREIVADIYTDRRDNVILNSFIPSDDSGTRSQMLIRKYTPGGQLTWALRLEPGWVTPPLATGDLLVVGVTRVAPRNIPDVVAMKIGADGTTRWTHLLGVNRTGGTSLSLNAVAVHPGGTLYVAGSTGATPKAFLAKVVAVP
jgi:hypothetical protein